MGSISEMKAGVGRNVHRTVDSLIKEHGDLKYKPKDWHIILVHGLYRGENYNGFFLTVESWSIYK